MRIRAATEADAPVLRELWTEFEAEVPEPEGWAPETWDDVWAAIRKHIAEGVVVLAEDDEGPLGLTVVARRAGGRAHVTDAYVRPRGRRQGVTKALLRAAAARLAERGVRYVSLDVLSDNAPARAVWERLGFREVQRTMVTELETLAARVAEGERPPSFGSIHIQTDDERSVARAVAQFVPRLGRSGGTRIEEPRNGWTVVYDELCDRDRAAQRRLAGELSDRLGAVAVAVALEEGAVVRFLLYDRGRMVDEYLSVPTYYGPLPRVDELALAANSTLVARLTGADPARVRAVVRTAGSPAELPPAAELLARIAETLGLTGAEHGFAAE